MSTPDEARNPSHLPPLQGPAATGGRALFIYYRIALTDAPAALAVARAVQQGLRERHPGLVAGLWRRPETKDGMQTWMETYTHADGVDEALAHHIETAAQALAPWRQGPRHVEVFVPCAC